jgi:hypothetical protein
MAVNLLRSLGSGLNAGLRGLGLRRSPDPEIDADYTRGLIRSFLVRLGRSAASLKGERILMVGPGYDLHSSLVLAGHGVEVTVVEKYLNDWITSFHPPFSTLPSWVLKPQE